MIEYILHRHCSRDEATLGALFRIRSDGKPEFHCYTLEDEQRKTKLPKETRIPAGRYQVAFRAAGGMHEKYKTRYSFHKGMLWLLAVPGFEYIYIHPGNTDEHTEGCILVGQVADTRGRMRIDSSVAAYTDLYQEMAGLIEAGEIIILDVRDYA